MNLLLSHFGPFVTALTPAERYQAMRNLFSSRSYGILNEVWFLVTVVAAAAGLAIVLLAIRRTRLERRRQYHQTIFDDECSRRGLSAEEREILSAIADESGSGQGTTVFNTAKAFSRGSAALMQKHFTSGNSIVDRKRLNATVRSIQQKLGFEEATSQSIVRRRAGGMSSRTLPVGKQVTLAAKGEPPDAPRIDAVVTRNDDFELAVRPDTDVSARPGQMWNVRYTSGVTTWEFDALTVVCRPDRLELSHSDDIRFVSRRRFVRATVRKRALVARFPVLRTGCTEKNPAPVFTRATVTEISGPGIRLLTDIDAEPGDRLLVVFELEKGKIIQDLAEVRGPRDTVVSHSLALELVGVGEAGINELIRFSNTVAATQGQHEPLPQDDAAIEQEATYG